MLRAFLVPVQKVTYVFRQQIEYISFSTRLSIVTPKLTFGLCEASVYKFLNRSQWAEYDLIFLVRKLILRAGMYQWHTSITSAALFRLTSWTTLAFVRRMKTVGRMRSLTSSITTCASEAAISLALCTHQT